MWARVIELMLGSWLALSPFIFRHPAEETALWFNDLFSALAVIVLALISFWPPLRYAHLAIVVVALWLIGFGFWASGYPAPPALQNDILVGLVLLMFAIIPNEANLPPQAWRSLLVGTQISRAQAETQVERQSTNRDGEKITRGRCGCE